MKFKIIFYKEDCRTKLRIYLNPQSKVTDSPRIQDGYGLKSDSWAFHSHPSLIKAYLISHVGKYLHACSLLIFRKKIIIIILKNIKNILPQGMEPSHLKGKQLDYYHNTIEAGRFKNIFEITGSNYRAV